MTIKRHTKGFLRYLRSTRAVSALEYAILVGVIVAAIGLALNTFSANIATLMTNLGSNIAGTTAPTSPTLTTTGTN